MDNLHTACMNRQADARVSRTVQHLLVDRPGVTRADLADACGISYNALAMKLRGDRPWRLDEVLCIADFFDVQVSTLLNPPEWLPTNQPSATSNAGGPGGKLPRLDSNQQPAGYPALPDALVAA